MYSNMNKIRLISTQKEQFCWSI